MTDPIRFKLGLAGGLVTDAEGDWITYRTHVAAIARLAECERLLALSQTAKILRTVSRPPLQFICSLCGEPVHDGDCAAMGGGT